VPLDEQAERLLVAIPCPQDGLPVVGMHLRA
jgi:hypothetical protein